GALELGSPGSTAVELAEKPTIALARSLVTERPTSPPPADFSETLAREVGARMAGLQACYESALKRAPSLRGRLVLAFTLGADGRPKDVELEEDGIGHSPLAQCVVRRV